jgi:hypothetical protein
MYAFQFYGINLNCDSKVLLKLLDMNCTPEQIYQVEYLCGDGYSDWYDEFYGNGYGYGDRYGDHYSALMYAFKHYGTNPNCDSRVLLKLLDMNCIPEQVGTDNSTALKHAFKFYGKNPNYDPCVFIKLINLLYPSITRFQLIDLLNANTDDSILKAKILREYNYSVRNKLINNRIFKRRIMGKGNCIHLF